MLDALGYWHPDLTNYGDTWTTAMTRGGCGWCGMWHNGMCSKVKSIEYNGDGSIYRVEFK